MQKSQIVGIQLKITNAIVMKLQSLNEMIKQVNQKKESYKKGLDKAVATAIVLGDKKYGGCNYIVCFDGYDSNDYYTELEDDTKAILKVVEQERGRMIALSETIEQSKDINHIMKQHKLIPNPGFMEELEGYFDQYGEFQIQQTQIKQDTQKKEVKSPQPKKQIKTPAKTPMTPMIKKSKVLSPKNELQNAKIRVTTKNQNTMKEFKNIAQDNLSKTYKPLKGDQLDTVFAQILNESGIDLNVQRISPGVYLVGSKQIFMKIINGNLLVRMGGGFLKAQDFIKQFGMSEMVRMETKGRIDNAKSAKNQIPINQKKIVGIGEMKQVMRDNMLTAEVNPELSQGKNQVDFITKKVEEKQ